MHSVRRRCVDGRGDLVVLVPARRGIVVSVLLVELHVLLLVVVVLLLLQVRLLLLLLLLLLLHR